MLKPFWKNKDHFWVTFDKEDARSLLEGEKMYPCYYPTNRSLKALIKNTKIAWNVLHKEKPDLIISCVLPLFQMIKRKKIWASCGVFVGISALESTCLIWGSTYLSDTIGLSADMAAALITFYFAGMTLGRFLSGLLSLKFSDWKIITIGESIILAAVCILLLTNTVSFAVLGLFLVGLGNGPIFPNMTHLTPILYKKETSQSIIGIEMAFSNLSIMLTPVLFGFLSDITGTKIFPVFMAVMFAFMAGCTIILKTGDSRSR